MDFALFPIHHAAAFRRTATAGDFRKVPLESIVREQFLAGLNPAAAEEEQAPANPANGKIGVATVIDELGAALAGEAVDHDVAIQPSKIDIIARFTEAQIAPETAAGLREGEMVAQVFDDLLAARNCVEGEDAPAMDFRTGDAQSEWRELLGNRARF